MLLLETFFVASTIMIMAYLVRHYIFTFTILRHSRKSIKDTHSVTGDFKPIVTILIPAHNEEKVLSRLLQQIVLLTYPKDKLEVIIIDDASTDQTGKIADDFSKKVKFIKVVHRGKKVGAKGKPAALNNALGFSRGEIIICFDADYVPELQIIEKLVQPFQDSTVGAVQGRPIVLNEPANLLTRMIALERISGYKIDQAARENLGLIPQFGGTVGGFRRCIIEELGGFDESKLTEDTDLTFQIFLSGYKITYLDNAECYEEAVDDLSAYWKQRLRWARGHMQVCFKHVFNVLTSKNLNLKQRIDGFLLLNIYFLPILSLFSLLFGAALVFSGSQVAGVFWFSVPVAFYSFVGNFAPFFEVGIGAYIDGRRRIQWLMPFLFFSYILNIFICLNALIEEIIGVVMAKPGKWVKTEHNLNGRLYYEQVLNQSKGEPRIA